MNNARTKVREFDVDRRIVKCLMHCSMNYVPISQFTYDFV
jgi:hypothetical protein